MACDICGSEKHSLDEHVEADLQAFEAEAASGVKAKTRKPPRLRVVEGGAAAGITSHCTDLANAEALIRLFGTELRFVREWGKWLAWDGRRWVEDKNAVRVHRMACETARSMMREAVSQLEAAKLMPPDEDGGVAKADAMKRAKTNLAWAKETQGASRLRAMIETARSDATLLVSFADLDADPWKLNVRNGTIDLKKGRLNKPSRLDLITKLAPVNYVDNAKAPVWDNFVKQVWPSAQKRSYIQRSIGYALTGSIEEHCLFFHYGDGGRGKSTFLIVFHQILGDYAAKAPRKLLFTSRNERHPTELATLHGARFVTGAEVEEGKTFDDALVKDLTGGDPISTRRMQEDFWSFMPTHKFFLAGNYKPTVRGDDEGIWRRIRLIPWTVEIPKKKRDKKLPAKLRKELEGILAWAVRGCMMWMKDGLTEPREIEEATAEYREESDRLGEFFRLRCAFETEAKVARSELRAAYTTYLEENGDDRPLSPKNFASKLRSRGVIDGGTIRADRNKPPADAWQGIRLLTEKERNSRAKQGL